MLALLWLSSSVFVEIIDAMNVILGVKETRPFWKRRLLAVAMMLIEAAILIATMITTLAWPQILSWLGISDRLSILITAAHAIIVSLMVFFCFALALLIGPDSDQFWEWTTPGSLLGTVVLLGTSVLFRYYAHYVGGYSATYGSLAGIIALMTWLWLGSVVLLVAAELNCVIQNACGIDARDVPGPAAVRALEERRPATSELLLPRGASGRSPRVDE